ncbi:MAG: hypothetical protein AB7U82_09785 [Blastocatellales bacterium]
MSAIAAIQKVEAFSTFEEIESLIHEFESGMLPRSQWDHKAHLTVACWYLVCYPEPEATLRIREGIQRYNKAVGIVTTRENGYHETMTVFWINMVKRFLRSATLECSLVGLMNNLAGRYANKGLPFEYYSRDLLMSWEARLNWIEPDLKSMPCGNRQEQGEGSGAG